MKKHWARSFALVGVLLLTFSLCGCGLLDQLEKVLPELPFLQKSDKMQTAENPETTEYVLTGPTDFYEEPDRDSPILATYYAGHTVVYNSVLTIDGVRWAGSNAGWFMLDGSKPVDILDMYAVQQEGFALESMTVYAEPSTAAAAADTVRAGNPVSIDQIAETPEGTWAHISSGWVLLRNIYSPGQTGTHYGFGVTRENNVSLFSAPGVQSYINTTVASGTRFEILEQINIDGYWWGYTGSGWINMEQVYLEGTEGARPCSAIVIDPTPLNVRIAPGTDKDILTTLTYGDHVNILERVNYNGSDWGFTGTGWIFMDLTEIQ